MVFRCKQLYNSSCVRDIMPQICFYYFLVSLILNRRGLFTFKEKVFVSHERIDGLTANYFWMSASVNAFLWSRLLFSLGCIKQTKGKQHSSTGLFSIFCPIIAFINIDCYDGRICHRNKMTADIIVLGCGIFAKIHILLPHSLVTRTSSLSP